MKKEKVIDVLQTKKQELAEITMEFDSAVSMVNNTVQNLCNLNDKISEKIKEIDDYQAELSQTRAGLDSTMERNSKVISNFKALLCQE